MPISFSLTHSLNLVQSSFVDFQVGFFIGLFASLLLFFFFFSFFRLVLIIICLLHLSHLFLHYIYPCRSPTLFKTFGFKTLFLLVCGSTGLSLLILFKKSFSFLYIASSDSCLKSSISLNFVNLYCELYIKFLCCFFLIFTLFVFVFFLMLKLHPMENTQIQFFQVHLVCALNLRQSNIRIFPKDLQKIKQIFLLFL